MNALLCLIEMIFCVNERKIAPIESTLEYKLHIANVLRSQLFTISEQCYTDDVAEGFFESRKVKISTKPPKPAPYRIYLPEGENPLINLVNLSKQSG